ncbi:bifunctional diguanylate cyclase/phosphodiesterase [Novosphingobium sp. AAP83]|uniref:putative bifunctional diguanylate cyclase/phosphodiesterase n=1 Tax=Novosphingobium sp. AAP83 TaxID=1523425 RepID=UPI0012F715F2|nr:EAL domain-containing protein [Novosphingobium sp. AAP83]
MASMPHDQKTKREKMAKADKDLIGLGIVVAMIILIIANGSSVIADFVTSLISNGKPLDDILSAALLLNVALLLFGCRRYMDLTGEVSQRRQAEEIARTLAQTDPLTGCLNRRTIDDALQDMIASARITGHEVVTMVIDLDHFKRSNDVHGHLAGDAVLLEATRRIRSALPERSIIARLGGDEFACAAIYDPDHSEAIDRLVLRINEQIAHPIIINSLAIEVTASVGLATTSSSDSSASQKLATTLLHRADLAMYQAKKAGRNGYRWFDASLESELRYRNELEHSIRQGIPAGEFVPFYEKQIDLDTGQLTGFEMLARWKNPRRGLMSPDVFIPVAEEIGLISDLSESLIRQALKDAREWNPRLTLSVNISPIQLRDPWFAQRLLRLLLEANFPPQRLDVEITESCLHENLGMVRTLITSLKNQGIRISLDDFGNGYSSFAQLRTLPFDQIKIDRHFVSNLDVSKDSATIIEAISSLGKGMGLPITAEGIETPEVLAELRKLGSFKGQGYLYGQPTDAQSVHEMLADQNMLRELATADDQFEHAAAA